MKWGGFGDVVATGSAQAAEKMLPAASCLSPVEDFPCYTYGKLLSSSSDMDCKYYPKGDQLL
jgi:hypothetical protein